MSTQDGVVVVRRTVAALAVLGALFGWVLVAPVATATPAPAAASTDAGIHAPITVGMRVCIASRTGYRCGYVTAVNQTICYPESCLYGIVRTNIVPQPGDNGAYVYNTSGAFLGVVIGGSGGSTFFDPV